MMLHETTGVILKTVGLLFEWLLLNHKMYGNYPMFFSVMIDVSSAVLQHKQYFTGNLHTCYKCCNGKITPIHV